MNYQTTNGKALAPFHQKPGTPDDVIDATGLIVWEVAPHSMQRVSWAKYQAELAQAAAKAASYVAAGGGYAGRGFVTVDFDAPLADTVRPPARVAAEPKCTCGAKAAGLGGHSSWCDSAEARVQHGGES